MFKTKPDVRGFAEEGEGGGFVSGTEIRKDRGGSPHSIIAKVGCSQCFHPAVSVSDAK
jgi:hypothetical protein